ncbi:methylase [Corynebacterium renale]|uniref:site-specific DNA-methyltransferase (adenine-specific) n=2 Tax=Corynebacterium renale TaxID=1724 RepID=A0A2A9DQW2_9CORY|nr:type II restriction/modification system DNA methylase subunit YeeA [Corynebacterium renale]SQI25244.1 methylase [Corynebacterium renale]
MVRIDRGTVRKNLDEFKNFWSRQLKGWKETGETGIEKKYAQSFWADMFACFGINAARMNLFEQDARRASTGRHGWIDLFWPGTVIGEAKSPGEDLDKAYRQAIDYLQGGVNETELPRYILISDFARFRLVYLGDPEQRFDITFPLEDITDYLDQLRFLAGYDTVTKREEAEASALASKLMANMFRAMVGDDVDEETGDAAPTNPADEDLETMEASMYLTRLLFLLYGDDAGLWEQDLFYRFVNDYTNAENLGAQLNALFEVLNTPEDKRRHVPESMEKFPYVNGTIFERLMRTKYFTPEMRDALLAACRFNWSAISPAIFGSLFQLVKSKEARRADGEHYTSEKNILKTIGPLFLDELREEANKLIGSKSTSVKKLQEFRDSLATHVFCDPACGCGNFLVVAYRELRRIETDIIVEIRKREGQAGMALDVSWEQKLSIGQFYGFELNWWPSEIAKTAMFLVDHQANRELADAIGAAPDRLPIKVTAHITHGNALSFDWQERLPTGAGQTYVFGNPPFIGARLMTKEQKEELGQVWDGLKGVNQLDYVTGWHAQSLKLFENRIGSFAFVTTNSITQGDQVPHLFDPIFKNNWRIRFAHRTFVWDSEAPGKAAVHCVIVGFDRLQQPKARLWEYPEAKSDAVEIPVTRAINAYLVDGPNVLVTKRRRPLSSCIAPASFGSMPNDGGNLIVEIDEYESIAADPVTEKYLRPFRMGRELVRGLDRWCLWMADDFDPADLQRSKQLYERVQKVKEHREKSKRLATRKRASVPYLFGEIHQPGVPYVGIPRVVSESRKFYTVGHLSPEIIAGDKVYTAVDPNGLLFGLISSSMFITWQRAVGGRLKSDLNFANTLTWNNFPVPELDEKTKQRIIDAGQKVLEARELRPERSLAEHYNPLAMDPALLKAHNALDREVDKAFGAERKLTSERQRQELLFENYARLTFEEAKK